MTLTQYESGDLNPGHRLRGLYAITADPQPASAPLLTQVEQAIIGGARIIQYRNKAADDRRRQQQAMALGELCRRHGVMLIINDDPALALDVGADGVHLGREDGTIAAARQRLGEQAIIGSSCYNRLDCAIQAEQAGADYVAFGSFYPSSTKPGAVMATQSLLKQARQRLSIPIVAIGGITAGNGANLIAAGATALAVVSGVFAQTDITAAARAYARLFDNNSEP